MRLSNGRVFQRSAIPALQYLETKGMLARYPIIKENASMLFTSSMILDFSSEQCHLKLPGKRKSCVRLSQFLFFAEVEDVMIKMSAAFTLPVMQTKMCKILGSWISAWVVEGYPGLIPIWGSWRLLGGESLFFMITVPGRMPMLQWMDPNSWTCEQN